MSRSGLRASVLGLVALVLGLTGCGVPIDDAPRELAAADAPLDLSGGQTPPAPAFRGDVEVFLVGPERLAAVDRDIADPDNPHQRIEELLKGPTEAEQNDGLRTAIPPDTRLLGVTRVGAVLTIDLSAEFLDVQGELLQLAVAQLVFTATELDTVQAIHVAVEGERRAAPVEEGFESREPLTRFDYPSLDPTLLPQPTPRGNVSTTAPPTTAAAPVD